jgi:hypothetical protein
MVETHVRILIEAISRRSIFENTRDQTLMSTVEKHQSSAPKTAHRGKLKDKIAITP